MSQPSAAVATAGGGNNDRTTLSDLLADDVRDYFLREAPALVASAPMTAAPATSRRNVYESEARQRRRRRRRRILLGGNSKDAKQLSTSTSQIMSLSSSCSEDGDSAGDSVSGEHDIIRWRKKRMESYKSYQHNYGDYGCRREKQMRGQNTAERPENATYQNIPDASSRSFQNYTLRQQQQDRQTQQSHRPHVSSFGSGSFTSHKQNNSFGSGSGSGSGISSSYHRTGKSSKRTDLTTADAEFLHRYAVERERASSRINNLSPYSIQSNPMSPSSSLYYKDPSQPPSRRPPTVTGSHRPALPSIDNDDWEEEDGIEKGLNDKARKELEKMKGTKRKKKKDDEKMAAAAALRDNSDRGSMEAYHLYQQRDAGASYRNRAMSPQQPNQRQILQNMPERDAFSPRSNVMNSKSIHERDDSMGTFVRLRRSLGDGSSFCGGDSPNDSVVSSIHHNSRPLSYLSASSRSGSSDEDESMPSTLALHRHRGEPRHLFDAPAPAIMGGISSRSGDHGYYQTQVVNNNNAIDFGNNIYSSTVGSDSGSVLSEDDEPPSSDEGFETDEEGHSESWDSSCTSSHSSSKPLIKASSSRDGRKLVRSASNNKSNDRGGENVIPSGERESLFGRSNYSSMNRMDVTRESFRFSSGDSSSSKARTKKKGDGYLPRKKMAKNHHHQHHRLGGSGWPLRLDDALEALGVKIDAFIMVVGLFISNMPSLVGSLALAWVSLGVDWFKWYEDDACHPIHYHSDGCVFPEFPGCFACDTDRDGYQFALHFHYMCSSISFILCSLLLGKLIIAFPVVRDELANPTTAAPLGLLCMAVEKVVGGNFGSTGMGIILFASALHTIVACWFIFISVVYKTLPEPSWFPNTTGIGLAAVKVYLYWTGGGYFLSGLSLLAFIMFYFVSLFRIHTNEKISVPVCWAQLSGPAVVLYGFSIFSQPGSREDDLALMIPENKQHFYRIHHQYYMPVMHALFALCMVSMASSLYLLRARWESFRGKEFSPAHVGFCAPLVSHANALQTYRLSLNGFSSSSSGITFKLLLYQYWTLTLIVGTGLVVVMTWKFFVHLPGWCQINVDDDEMPPEPEKTIVTQLLQKGNAGDSMRQNFVSAAVLQANESGALVRVVQDGKMKYVRSRRMHSMGFDPMMNVAELISERDRLLQHVTYAAHPSRDRGGVSSFDGTLLDATNESDRLHMSSGRRRLNFLSFDASTIMRGDH